MSYFDDVENFNKTSAMMMWWL